MAHPESLIYPVSSSRNGVLVRHSHLANAVRLRTGAQRSFQDSRSRITDKRLFTYSRPERHLRQHGHCSEPGCLRKETGSASNIMNGVLDHRIPRGFLVGLSEAHAVS